jgi:predicted nucleic acid-binding protein
MKSCTKISIGKTRNNDSDKPIALLDTNAINDLLDDRLDLKALAKFHPYITSIQYDELLADPDFARRQLLLAAVSERKIELFHTGVFVAGYTRVGMSKIGMGWIYSHVLNALQSGRSSRVAKRKFCSDTRDAILAETAINEGMTLITNDAELLRLVHSLNGYAEDLRLIKNGQP